MGQLKQSSTAGGGLVWTQTNLPLAPQETTLLYKGMEVVDNTNNQTVGGNKTFTGTVKINNAPVASTDGVNKSYADSLSAQAVKSVTGTDPIVATAGKTPVISIKDATPTQKGSMSAADKAKLDGHPTLVVNKAGDTMTGNLTTTAGLYADGEIRSKNGLISTDSTNTYTTRIAVVGSIGYFQSGATNRDITDQKMILTGWLGTPLTMSKFTMANGVNPQVQWGSTNYDILHRGNMPTVTDLNAVSKSGDTIAHLTINPNGYFKQNYHIDAGYKFSKLIGSITDSKAGLIVLGENLSTNQNPEGFVGTISIQRGNSGSYIITNVINLVVKKAYNSVEARIISTTPPRAGGRLCKITHEGKEYIAYYSSPTSNRNVVVDGISWGIEPFVIPDATGYVLSDLISSTDTTRTDTNDYMLNNNNNERVPSWGLGEGQGFVMHGKTAIGGANDGWLRLNPFDAFTTGIYTGNGIIRHGGTSIQLGSLGDDKATTLYRPNDAAWSLTTGYAAVSVKQQTSLAAHWLLGSYKSSFEGDMRAGIQVLSNDIGTMRIYTNMRKHYAEISNGNILVSGAQSSSGSSLTKKDYVDSQDALKLNKAGDTMTGNLTVNANINASNIYSTGSITANTTSTFSGLGLSSNSNGYSEIVPRRANEADYRWSNGIRYYDSYNYWAIGVDRIHTDTYAPILTPIASPSDLNTISVPAKSMSLAHFWSSATNKPNTSDSANSVIHISNYETGKYAHQLAFSSDGKIYNRYNNNVSWSDWGQVYTSIYKPNPADVGAVNKSGDTMTGRLSIEGHNSAGSFGVKRLNSTQFANYGQSGDNGGEVIIGVGPTAEDFVAYLKVGLDKLTFQNGLSVERKIYHEGFKPNPADVGAVNKAGDTMTGNLTVPAVLVSSAQNTSINALTRKDYVDAAIDTKASNRVNFATGLGIARAITGATLPTHAGVWGVNNSTWTPHTYGSLYVTTNRADELTTNGPGVFIHYLFISHNAAKVYSATNVNGIWSGWKLTDEDSLKKVGDQELVGNVTIKTNAPILTLHESDTGKKWLLVADGYGCRFQMDNTSGLNAWAVDSAGTVSIYDPRSTTVQGGAAGSLTRKDYVDGQIGTRSPNGHLHTAADANSNIISGAQYAVGSYILAQKLTSSANGYGDNILGSSLIPASAGNRYWDGHPIPGTWKCMGYAADTSQEVDQRTTLFIRIS